MDQPPRLIETIVSWILESNDNLSGVKIIPLEQPSMIESSTNSLLLVLLQDSKRTITIKKKDSIPAFVLADYPMVVHPNLHSGPFSDIFSRLGIPENKNRIIAGSRAIIYDTLEHTDAYYVSSDLKQGYRKIETPQNLRSFLIDGCTITSEIGWIRHEDYTLSPIAKEFSDILPPLS